MNNRFMIGLSGIAAAGLLLATVGNGAQNLTLDQIISQPDLWPKEVTLTAPVPTPLVIDGKTVGTAEVPAGTTLPLLKLEAAKVQLNFKGTIITVSPTATDVLERARQNVKAQEALARARAQVAASAPPVPAAKATPAAPLSAMAKEVAGDLMQLKDDTIVAYNDAGLNKVKYYAVYFSASWCPPCRAFTPKLVSFYNQIKPKHPEFELVFVSRDRSSSAAEKYIKTDKMLWPFVKFSQIRESKLNRFAGGGIPCLVFVDQDGNILSDSYEDKRYVGPYKVMQAIEKILGQ